MAAPGGNGFSIGMLLLRLGAGGMLLYGHGWGKLMRYGERAPRFPDPIGLGPELGFGLTVFAEVGCAILVMVGFATRLAAIPPAIVVAVAGFVHHAADPFGRKELAFLYLAAFLAIAFAGPGRYALDARFGPRLSFKGD